MFFENNQTITKNYEKNLGGKLDTIIVSNLSIKYDSKLFVFNESIYWLFALWLFDIPSLLDFMIDLISNSSDFKFHKITLGFCTQFSYGPWLINVFDFLGKKNLTPEGKLGNRDLRPFCLRNSLVIWIYSIYCCICQVLGVN